MSSERSRETAAPTAGVLAALAVLAAVVAPYLLISPSEAGVYYGVPVPVPVHLVVGLFAAVAIIVFAAGRNDRTDPETAAGAAVVLGGFMTALTLWWAIAAGDVVGSFPTDAAFDYHRWVLFGTALAVATSAGWYAREVL